MITLKLNLGYWQVNFLLREGVGYEGISFWWTGGESQDAGLPGCLSVYCGGNLEG